MSDDATVPDEPAPSATLVAPTAIRFVSQATVGDLVWHNAELVRRSAFVTVIGTFVTVISVFATIAGDRLSILGILLGLSFLTGLFVVPFVWWSVRQRRDLLLAPFTVEADDEGLTLTSSGATSQLAWSVYRRARETRRAFVLDTGAGTVVVLLKRAMDQTDRDAFRGLLVRLGLLPDRPTLSGRLRPLLGVAVGLLGTVVLAGGLYLVGRAGTTVAVDAVPSVDGRHVSIYGTADLPDGSIVGVQVFQFDAWQQALASGDGAGLASFPFLVYRATVVHDGKFSAEADMTGWPAGHGMAAVYFWVDGNQPDEVRARFGADGAGLKGPAVYIDDDTGRTLRVDRPFDVP